LENDMKIVWAGLLAVLLAAFAWSPPASAQVVPRGSYLNTCNNVVTRGDTLMATCRMVDGRPLRTALAPVRACAGDIGNDNGVLQCTLVDGRLARGTVVAEPGYRPPPPVVAPPVVALPYYPVERCRELARWADDIRFRRDRTLNPIERARLEEQLRWVRGEQAARCRY
jgi:hypothetical protein